VVTDHGTPPDLLHELAESEVSVILERIAEHPFVKPVTLTKLSDHNDENVRAAVADNRNTPKEVMRTLANDPHPDVRYRVAENHHAPKKVLELLAEDSNPYVAHRARTTLKRVNDSQNVIESDFPENNQGSGGSLTNVS
jgi:uncharacterized protein (DUF2336 family)